MSTAATLPGIEEHPHARAVLLPALPPGEASHAYLFHGPAGAGKRAIARAFAAALLSDGAQDPEAAAERVERGTHPDLTWVIPSGASEMLVADIDEPVVAAAARTPFESRRRVFVLEGAETMHDATANRLLKTLEEPPAFVHLILLTSRPGEVLPTVASRCLHEAEKWFRRAAELGNALAENSLGALYLQGLGVKQDKNEALKWFQQSAQNGCAEGQNSYAVLPTPRKTLLLLPHGFAGLPTRDTPAPNMPLASFLKKVWAVRRTWPKRYCGTLGPPDRVTREPNSVSGKCTARGGASKLITSRPINGSSWPNCKGSRKLKTKSPLAPRSCPKMSWTPPKMR